MSTRKIDDDVRSSYPYPLAATFHRAFYDTRDVALIHDYLLDLFEITLKYLSSCALAQYIYDGGFDPAISASLVNLQKPTLENWQNWLVDTVRVYQEQNRELRIAEIAGFLAQNSSGEILTAFTHVRDLMAERMEYSDHAGERTQVTVKEFFDLLAQYRGRATLAAKLSIYERREVVEWLLPAMRELFVALAFIARYRLVFINEVKLAGSRRDVRYEHFVTDLTGYGPSVINEPFVLQEPSARPGELYVCAQDEDFAPLFSLHPFLIYHYCRECSADQTFALRLNRENNLVYYSSQCSHQFGLTDYLDDISVVIGALSNSGAVGANLAANLVTSSPASVAGSGAATQEPVGLSMAQQKAQVEIEEQQRQLEEERRKLEEERRRIAAELAQLQDGAQPTAAAPAPQYTLCPNCGQENQPGKKFCTTCGKPLSTPTGQIANPAPTPSVPPVSPVTAPPQAYHWPSGADPLPWEQQPAGVTPTMPIAPSPGQAAPSVAAPVRVCPRCGQKNNAKTKFCTQCGLALPPS